MSVEQRALLALFDQEQRVDITYPETIKEVTPHVVRFVRPGAGMNFILYSRLDHTNADAVIDEQIAYFAQFNQVFTWKVYAHDTPEDLKDRLEMKGFTPDDLDAVMILDLQSAPDALLAPIQPVLEEITDRAGLAAVISVLEAVWGDSFAWVTDRIGGHLEIPGYINVYLARVDTQPAAVAWIYFHEGSQFASLWGGSTLKGYRGRGLYTALLARRVQEARRRGYRYLVIDTGPMSRPIVEKHGFRVLTYAQDFEYEEEAALG